MTVYDGEELLGPPFSAELLADLHAGVLSESVSSRLWPLVRQDPAAVEVLAALDAVSCRLGELGRDLSVESPIPSEVAARIDAALGLQHPAPATATPLADAFGRRRALTWISVAAASMAAAVGVVFALTTLDGADPKSPAIAAPSTTVPTPSLANLSADLDDDQVLALIGDKAAAENEDLGELEKADVRTACLQANGIERTRPVLGSRQVRFQGEGAVLILVAGPRPPALTAVVVGLGCSAAEPQLFARTEID
ncbi:hypothetical protein ERC79_11460 [Rhodococcus sp. ABRD24]|uniref:hypothetical protein n=1 Tax=Rhodococcus sp. ABRD24 TaxID=2507582 RepID=UPI00103E826E|nr:hypothetical protein [Rhodococcus sp. ABRD24]QBJ96507.1 hypothetical protein ERC79_11460 [Rhodococcus sp. ABRD24]